MYPSETAKIRNRVLMYSQGDLVLDIGCGNDLIVPMAFGIDARPLPTVKHVTTDLYGLSEQLPDMVGKCDAVFSSHCLEHIPDDTRALRDWIKFLKPGGHLILYLPDTRHYNDVTNPEHVHSYIYEVFIRWFRQSFGPTMEMTRHGPDIGEDRYSFFLVAKRRA